MNIGEAWAFQRGHSTKLSDVVRQSAVAGLAVIWIFHTGSVPQVSVPKLLVSGACLYLAGLMLDAGQYFVLSRQWQKFCEGQDRQLAARYRDLKQLKAAEFLAPTTINRLGFWLFVAKLVAVSVGHVLVIGHLTVEYW